MSRNLFIAAGIFHPEPGGPATNLYELLPQLQARDWNIDVLTYGNDREQTYPYPVKRIQRRPFPIRWSYYALSTRSRLKWADIVFAHTIDLPLYGSRHAPRIIKIAGDQAWERCIRRGWIAPTTDIDDFQTGDYGTKVRWQTQSRSRQVRSFEGVIVGSEYLKRLVVGWGVPPEQVHVIYNSLPITTRALDISQAEARNQLGLEDARTLFAAARLTAWKGIDHLITVLKQVPDIRLIVAGDGSERDRLEHLAKPIKDRVTFLGNIPRKQVQMYMKATDYFVLYSGYEGLPHTVLESLHEGTPVIASKKGGNPEIVQHQINGLIVPYVDVGALTEAVKAAFQPGKREMLAANTQVGMERFRFDHMVKQTHETLLSYL